MTLTWLQNWIQPKDKEREENWLQLAHNDLQQLFSIQYGWFVEVEIVRIINFYRWLSEDYVNLLQNINNQRHGQC